MDELKTLISQKTGIPVQLLVGESSQEILRHAQELLDYKNGPGRMDEEAARKLSADMKRAEIKAIKGDRARLQAIRENIDLF